MTEGELCAICGVSMAEGTIDRHHLVPNAKGGKETARVHRVCRRFIHATFTNNELRDLYSTVERLKRHAEVEAFANWVSKELRRNPRFEGSSKESHRRRSAR